MTSVLVVIASAGHTAPREDGAGPRHTAAVHHTSIRCRQCHPRQREEWLASAHARAATSGAYHRALEHVPDARRPSCAPCHVPLAGNPERIATEGVVCDACHTADAAARPGGVTPRPELATKFGPYADSKDHHFHRVAFSAFVAGSDLCIACHSDPEAGPVVVLTSAVEWRAGPHASRSCPSCHMPGSKARAAKGGPERTVYHHGFGADRAKSLERAIHVKTRVARTERAAELSVSLTNAGAGHAIPTDLPERRLRLEIEGRSASGEPVVRFERAFGRHLVDAANQPAPFFLAVRELADERLAAGATRHERFELPAGTARVRIRLSYQRWDPAFDRYYGPSEPVLVHDSEVRVR